MDEKTQRYLHRIDQIMLTPTKATPQGRPSRSPLTGRPQYLDKYIKYELSTKIIQNIIMKNHIQLTNSFFNALRNTEFRQRERIYKFIAVEKSQKRQMKVDPAVSAKILLTVLKDFSKKRYADFINSLQEYSKTSSSRPLPTSNRATLTKQRSAKESTGYGVLMRTTTNVDRDNYRMVSEWIDDSSALEEKQNGKAEQTKKLESIAAKTIVKAVQIKIQGILLFGLWNLQVFACLKKQNKGHVSIDNHEQPKQKEDYAKVMKKIQASYDFVSFSKKKIASIFAVLKAHQKSRLLLETQAAYFNEILNGVSNKLRLKHFHHFFIRIIISKPKTRLYRSQVLQLQPKNRSQMKLSSHSKQSKKSNESEVQAFKPLVKLNFYSFLDRIVKFIFLVSKMLIPMREAFMQIDQYASFAYRLEESLKVAPNRYLLESFMMIKQRVHKKIAEPIIQAKEQKDCKLAQCLAASVAERLIDGFIHIKIMAESRKRNVRKPSARESIIESTKRFIQDREEYTSQSYENWNQIKSNFMSPTSKFRKLEIEI